MCLQITAWWRPTPGPAAPPSPSSTTTHTPETVTDSLMVVVGATRTGMTAWRSVWATAAWTVRTLIVTSQCPPHKHSGPVWRAAEWKPLEYQKKTRHIRLHILPLNKLCVFPPGLVSCYHGTQNHWTVGQFVPTSYTLLWHHHQVSCYHQLLMS